MCVVRAASTDLGYPDTVAQGGAILERVYESSKKEQNVGISRSVRGRNPRITPFRGFEQRGEKLLPERWFRVRVVAVGDNKAAQVDH